MNLIYSNNYGACYKIDKGSKSKYILQLVIDSIGIFMTKEDLKDFLVIILQEPPPCTCKECGGERCNKIWCSGPFLDVCLKVNPDVLKQLEDLIRGSLFILEMDKTLDEFRIN